jgi:two-component system NtrC family sensor kinase
VKLVKENKTISGKYDESNIIELSEIIRGMNQLFEVVNENFINYQIELEKNIKIKNDLETLVVKKSEQLIQKEKMAALGVMTAGIAHEIKNPLNLICNTAEIISLQLEKIEISGLVNDKDIVERFEKIKNSNKILTANGKRVDNIIRTLLMQTRTGNSSEHQKIVLDEIIKTSLDFILVINRPKINNQINISFQKPDDKIFILANPINLGRVFINIFDNSIYAITKKLRQTAYNAEIKIEVSVIYNMVEIRIRDNGVGMNKDQLKNALTPFYTTKPAGEGSGLGLSFAYDNIRDLGGNLEIVSEENEFTEIIISLPLKEDA